MKFQNLTALVFSFVGLASGCAPQSSMDAKDLARMWQKQAVRNGVHLNGINLNGLPFGNGINLNGVNLNGINLNGINLNGINLNGVNLNGGDLNGINPVTSETVHSTDLAAAIMAGALSNNDSLDIRVDSVSTEYQFAVFKMSMLWPFYGTTIPLPLCGSHCPDDNPDCEEEEMIPYDAVAMPGTWDATSGAWSSSTTQFTLACTNAALGKCAKWGYWPFSSAREYDGTRPSPEPETCSDTDSPACATRSLADYHESCTRLVRADYCGDGTPHTRDGTSINVWDNVSVQQKSDLSSATPPYHFEAEWAADGARCINKTRWIQGDTGQALSTDLLYVQTYCPERLKVNDPPCTQDSQCGSGTCNTTAQVCVCSSTSCSTGFSCNGSTGHCETNDSTCWDQSTSNFSSSAGFSGSQSGRRLIRNETRDNDSLPQ